MANPFAIGGVLEIVYGVIAVVFAYIVFHAGPKNPVNRTLAVLLLVDGATSGGLVVGISRFVDDPGLVRALRAVQFLGNGSRPFLYLAFIVTAMPFAWTRFMDNRNGRIALWLLAAAGGLLAALLGIRYPWVKDSLQLCFILVGLLGFASALIAYRKAQVDRHKTRAYLQAFAVRDVGAGILLPIRDLAVDGSLLQGWTLVAVKAVYVVFIFLVVYGVLWGQIVNLDRTARVTFGRTIAVTVVAIAFIAITGTVENLFGVDDPIIALLVSVAVAFMFQPVQDLAEGWARAMFPGDPIEATTVGSIVAQAVGSGELARKEQRIIDDIVRRNK